MVLVSVGFAWNKDVRMVVGWRCGTVDGDDCVCTLCCEALL